VRPDGELLVDGAIFYFAPRTHTARLTRLGAIVPLTSWGIVVVIVVKVEYASLGSRLVVDAAAADEPDLWGDC